MKQLLKWIGMMSLLLFISCESGGTSRNSNEGKLSREISMQINSSCFEVVVKKPVKDSLTYEKPLPWDLIPYIIRNDPYYSIGTAFAISPTELLTAFHVLELDNDSKVYTEYAIRDIQGTVYPIDQILQFDSDRDFVRFTVKDKKFDTFLKMNEKFVMNQRVYSVGNAYGEGIIIREGDLIGTHPEPESNRFIFLKSSSDVNSGNSGGPLVNETGEVVGIVLQKKDNIAYSLPMNEVTKFKPLTGLFHQRNYFSFMLFEEKLDASFFDLELKLGDTIQNIRKKYHDGYKKHYNVKMDELFTQYQNDIFPKGVKSQDCLYSFSSSIRPQLIYKDKDNGTWGISNLKYERSAIGEEAVVYYAKVVDSLMAIYFEKPESMSYQELIQNPKTYMDYILKGINLPRTFANQKFRITSFGKPEKTETITDLYQRKWIYSIWNVEYSDESIVTFSTITPDGMLSLMGFINNTSSTELMYYDFKKMLDFVVINYYGRIKDWNSFTKETQYIPDYLKTIRYEVKDQSFTFESNHFKFNVDAKNIAINDETEFAVYYDVVEINNKINLELRKVLVSEYEKDNYMTMIKEVKPKDSYSKEVLKNWKDIRPGIHPFTETSYSSDGVTRIGSILPDFTQNDQVKDDNGYIMTLFFTREGTVDNKVMKENLDMIKNSFKLK